MKKGMLSLTLLLTLLLTACGGSAEEPQGQASSLLGAAAETDENAPLLTVSGREIPAWKYLYWLAETCRAIEEEYAAAGVELDWDAATEEGVLKEHSREQALEAVVLYATVENLAEEYGCMMEEKPETAVRFPARWGLNEQQRKEMESVGLLYGELYQLFCTEGSALAPKAEDAEAFAQDEGWIGIERIFVSAGEDRNTAKEDISRRFAALNAAEDMAAEFTKQAAESGGEDRQRTFRLGDGSLNSALEEAAQELEIGQVSGILETEEGFHILYRISPESTAFMEPFFDSKLRQAAARAEIRCTQTYKQLDAESFYTALLEQKGENTDGTWVGQ